MLESYTRKVPELRRFVYFAMALTLLTAPLLACTLPGMTMSEEERECCRHMADQCGQMQMDESHSCCTKTPSPNAGVLQQTVKYSPLPPEFATAILAPQSILPEITRIAGFPADSAPRLSESPPGSLSVLRI